MKKHKKKGTEKKNQNQECGFLISWKYVCSFSHKIKEKIRKQKCHNTYKYFLYERHIMQYIINFILHFLINMKNKINNFIFRVLFYFFLFSDGLLALKLLNVAMCEMRV